MIIIFFFFEKKKWLEGWVGGVSSIQFLGGFLDFFLFCKAP